MTLTLGLHSAPLKKKTKNKTAQEYVVPLSTAARLVVVSIMATAIVIQAMGGND